ncbi:TRAP transporter substrate-binding protein [Photobacterium sp. ZSDE20]|uniref:TRAP transporter substrate-binding protein n=1 Tax=Photobacterium pectinilyticum TaxID=2906793 RepID=A0ABT1NBU3_9GAMM|nr:TRAP transporter substrate-binding protein [Photobacterium sp. ZSDE20]MCQ1060804.1 TRAP transporter substrate-binding protein [Photobacterium sp. ZSDE20]MDD1828530.1 TRAP transporter substrate-binding protein [Photobacterium sp. ZSDE20]
MKKLNSKLSVSLIVGALTTFSTQAASVVMNVGWSTPEDSEYGILAKKFKALTEEYSNGEITVKLHCCGQTGTEDTAFNSLRLGIQDAYFITNNNISPHWPLMDVFTLPYVFENKEHAAKVFYGDVGKEIRESLYKDTKVTILTYGGLTYRDMYNSSKEINSIEDMKGLKIRVPKNTVMIDTFKAFGAEPIPLAWSETPTALQTRTIDGGDNGTTVIKDYKLYQFANNLTILDYFISVSPMLASNRFLSKLNDDQKELVFKAAEEAGLYQSEIMYKNTKQSREWLVNNGGMTMSEPDKTDFIAAAKQVQNSIISKRSGDFKVLVEKIQNDAP